MSSLYKTKQKLDKSLEQYHLQIESAVEMVKLSQGSIANHPCLLDHKQAGNGVCKQFNGNENLISSNLNTIVKESYMYKIRYKVWPSLKKLVLFEFLSFNFLRKR